MGEGERHTRILLTYYYTTPIRVTVLDAMFLFINMLYAFVCVVCYGLGAYANSPRALPPPETRKRGECTKLDDSSPSDPM